MVAFTSFLHRFRPGPVGGAEGLRTDIRYSTLLNLWCICRNDPDVFDIDPFCLEDSKPKMEVQKPKIEVSWVLCNCAKFSWHLAYFTKSAGHLPTSADVDDLGAPRETSRSL